MNWNQNQGKTPDSFDWDELNKQHRQHIIDTLAAYRAQLGSFRRIAANEGYSKRLRAKARELIPQVMQEMKWKREELEYERRLEELEAA